MELQIGYDDFGKVRSKGLAFVDKTLFIKEVLDNESNEVSIITRPRRFGKTFNLSTLRYFLASEVNQIKTNGMFDDLKIATVDNGSYMQYQGKYPVIFISFKEVKSDSYGLTYNKLCSLIANIFDMHSYLKQSDKLTEKDKQILQLIVDEKADQAKIENSLYFLSFILFKHHGIKPWLLIDEYDTPIQAGYVKDYYEEVVSLMRGILGTALKTNPYFDRAIVTGILRIAKESIFSELNNVTVYSLLQTQYSQQFGFTEKEVHEILVQTNLESQEVEIKRWYNGYVYGDATVYNPWSIVNYINCKIFKAFWVNTSDNLLIKQQLIKSSPEFKEQFKLLLQDKTVEKIINENMVFGDLENNSEAAWSLLLMSGYLKAISTNIDMGRIICKCAIPNLEVKILYRNIIEEWLGNGHGIMWYQNFLSCLLKGDIDSFEKYFGEILIRTISVHDTAHNPEAFYQGFMLGLAAGIDQNQYEVRSNRESGLGRYDIAIVPRDIKKIGIILELKSIMPPKVTKRTLAKVVDTLLVQEAQKALKQIDNNRYTIDLVHRGIVNIVKIGLAFSGKEFRVAYEGGGK